MQKARLRGRESCMKQTIDCVSVHNGTDMNLGRV
jgi:hypothetical protein